MPLRKISYFLSLRWKFVLSLVAMLTLVSVIIGALGLRRFDQQLDNVLHQQYDFLWRDYQIRLRDEEARLTALSQELHLMMGGERHRLTLAQIQQTLDGAWPDFELFWDLRALRVFDASLLPRMVYGEEDFVDQGWLNASLHSGEPIHRVRCLRLCYVDVAVPVLIDSELNLLVFTTGFDKILAQMAENHQVEVAMFGPIGREPVRLWSRPLLSLTHQEQSLPKLSAFAETVALEQVMSKPHELKLDGEPWAIYSWPVADSGETMLLFRNIHSLAQSERAFVGDLTGILLLAMLTAGGMGTLLFWRPLGRVRRLGQVLPLLAQSRFDDLRERLRRSPSRIGDELQQLENTTLEVANQLERLENDVDRYTNELQRMAMMDALTGLPNRAMFHHELAKSLGSIGRTDEQIALMFLDLDEFKRVNDTLGHDIGDELLKTVANRLQKSVRSMDTVCRLGGDEFTVIVRGLEQESDIHRIIHQIFASLQQPLQLGRHTLIITTSIGVVFCDNPMARPEELLKRADLAMYQAKQAGRSNYRVFNEQMLESASRKQMMEEEVRVAMEEQQLVLAMQPILTLKTQQLVGFEALLRWLHPTRGLLLPGEFLSDLADGEQEIALGRYVVNQVLALLDRYTRKFGQMEFYLSLNLSPTQYLHPDMVAFVQARLEHYQVAPQRLVLELTEEVLIKNLDQALSVLNQFKAMGVRIAIDDFGTGYSSLSYLKQLPFDMLKVDKGFVSDLDNSDVDRNIVTSVIELAHTLKRTVIAEGVESHDQRQFLLKAQCDCVQGYLYSAPMDEHQMSAMLERLGPEMIWGDEERLIGRPR
ncbi:bifunctional diguanylate cyclase/phosphodiesterase [Ferrimonas marina]|uniref:Diguanylate cyclase (GGDEF) domain-containing protein n=1 Tax=Ferrimonas marina TaxID=299255 RepID=A0A1M5VVC5_9GAMM|nr:EAL domain-containing protein [Ferrimonas marina]SHH79212.1 diguanylate cyclase (GGDEF) domain-containing protein [Ferrimonas marina]